MNVDNIISPVLERLLVRVANDARNELITLLSSSTPTGRIYRRGSITHQASAPGEVPAVDTGQLRQSLSIDISRVSQGFSLAGVLDGTIAVKKYAYDLEYGSRTAAARPFLRPVAEKLRNR
jgi:hypothetical protein